MTQILIFKRFSNLLKHIKYSIHPQMKLLHLHLCHIHQQTKVIQGKLYRHVLTRLTQL